MVRLQGISPGTGYLWLNRFFITSIIKQMDWKNVSDMKNISFAINVDC
jgi:hypothetical protein